MKKLIFLFLILVFCVSAEAQTNADTLLQKNEQTSVLYFHYTMRCATCLAVENEAKNVVQSLFPHEYERGEIQVKSVNLDEDESRALANQWDVSGQTLLIVKGDKKVDLTSKAFMYARTNPEKYHQEIRKAINSL